MKIQNPKLLLSSVIVCQLAGLVGSVFTTSSIATWYSVINKPSFNPPNWLFSPVWITLFFLMSLSLYLILNTKHKQRKIALTFFGIQLILNTLWSIIFFGLKSPFYAFIEIILLWFAILMTIIKFYKI